MIIVHPAREADISQIREMFRAVYGNDYPYKEFYDEQWLKRSLFNDNALMLVAQDSETGRIAGTASVIYEFGAYSDLIGEFGRLAVHPDFRSLGVGKLLMEKRIESIKDRLHLALVMARVVQPFSQQISLGHQFTPVGFLPLCYQFSQRESFAFLGRYFEPALGLRKNNPRVIPEIYPLANQVMPNVSLPCDVIVDEESAPYPPHDGFHLKEMTVKGYPSLLRIERGRVRHREIFGHMRLEYGFFKLQAKHATYLLASDEKQLLGAIGFTHDTTEHSVRIFELITFTDEAVRFLLAELERKCREEWGVEYLEIDVSAHAPRMQRTLLELEFLPVAYIPAMVFHEVERLDIIRMVRLPRLQDLGPMNLLPAVQEVADLVMSGFRTRSVTPKIAKVVSEIPLFQDMNKEQIHRLAATCRVKTFHQGERIFCENDEADHMYVLLDGRVGVSCGSPEVRVGIVEKAETLGELSLLSSSPHSATATAETNIETAVLSHHDFGELVRRRPDIGVIIYRNLGVGLGRKLLRSDHSLRQQVLEDSTLAKCQDAMTDGYDEDGWTRQVQD